MARLGLRVVETGAGGGRVGEQTKEKFQWSTTRVNLGEQAQRQRGHRIVICVYLSQIIFS